MKYSNPSREERPVAVIFGGEGCERDISRRSAETVVSALREMNIPLLPVYIDKSGLWYIVDGDLSLDKSAFIPTYPVRLSVSGFLSPEGIIEVRGAIPALHGELGEDGVIQGALRTAGIAYVGSDTAAGSVLMDKAYTKLLAEYMGIPTVPWFLFVGTEGESYSCGERIAESYSQAAALAGELGYPLFVKPARAGSSFGAGRADTEAELISAIERACLYGEPRVIVERCLISPLELECAFLDGERRVFTEAGGIDCRGFYSYDRKYCNTSSVQITERADIPESISRRIKEYSARLCLISGMRDIGRVDFFLDGDKLYFNEANSFPGMTDTSLYTGMLRKCGIDRSELFRTLIGRLGSRA